MPKSEPGKQRGESQHKDQVHKGSEVANDGIFEELKNHVAKQ